MTIYTIDTAAAIRKLKEAQCDETLAEAIVGIVAERQDEIATTVKLEALENRMKLWMFKALAIVAGVVVSMVKLLDYMLPAIGF